MDNIFEEIKAEKKRQEVKYGIQDHDPFIWTSILSEELGKADEALIDSYFSNIDIEEFRKHIVQLGAVCVSTLECLDNWDDESNEDLFEDDDEISSDEWMKPNVDGKMIEGERYEVITESGKTYSVLATEIGVSYEDEDFEDGDPTIMLFRKLN